MESSVFALKQIARLLLVVAVLFGSIGTRGTVLCWGEKGVAVESSYGGRCSSSAAFDSEAASLAERDSCGSCVDVPMPRTESYRLTVRAAQNDAPLAAAVAPLQSQWPNQHEVPLSGVWQWHSFSHSPDETVVLLI
jgi:hypothetical protein